MVLNSIYFENINGNELVNFARPQKISSGMYLFSDIISVYTNDMAKVFPQANVLGAKSISNLKANTDELLNISVKKMDNLLGLLQNLKLNLQTDSLPEKTENININQSQNQTILKVNEQNLSDILPKILRTLDIKPNSKIANQIKSAIEKGEKIDLEVEVNGEKVNLISILPLIFQAKPKNNFSEKITKNEIGNSELTKNTEDTILIEANVNSTFPDLTKNVEKIINSDVELAKNGDSQNSEIATYAIKYSISDLQNIAGDLKKIDAFTNTFSAEIAQVEKPLILKTSQIEKKVDDFSFTKPSKIQLNGLEPQQIVKNYDYKYQFQDFSNSENVNIQTTEMLKTGISEIKENLSSVLSQIQSGKILQSDVQNAIDKFTKMLQDIENSTNIAPENGKITVEIKSILASLDNLNKTIQTKVNESAKAENSAKKPILVENQKMETSENSTKQSVFGKVVQTEKLAKNSSNETKLEINGKGKNEIHLSEKQEKNVLENLVKNVVRKVEVLNEEITKSIENQPKVEKQLLFDSDVKKSENQVVSSEKVEINPINFEQKSINSQFKQNQQDPPTSQSFGKSENEISVVKNQSEFKQAVDEISNSSLQHNPNLKEFVVKTNLIESLKEIPKADIMKNVAEFIQTKEKSSIVLQLQPENLGKIKLAMEVVNDVVKASVAVENDSVKQMLESNLPELQLQMAKAGINLGQVNITLNQNTNSKFGKMAERENKKYNNIKEDVIETENQNISKRSFGYNTYEYLA